MKKQLDLVVVASSFAPQVTGSTVLLDNLLQEFEGSLEAVTGWAIDSKVDPDWKPVCKVHQLKLPTLLLNRIQRKFRYQLDFIIYAFIKRKLKSLKPKAVLSVFPNDIYPVTTFRVCKDLGIPYMIHMHDLWEENMKGKAIDFAKKWEKKILFEADIVYCMTSTQQDHYLAKYNLQTKLMPHTTSSALLERQRNDGIKNPLNKPKKLILYTGNVSNAMSLDAMQQFIKAVDLLPESYEVVCLTNPDKENLKHRKLYNPRVQYKWVSREQAQQLQNEADILFLPLSHKNGSADEVKTVFATKTLEYLVSGVPILTFAPSDSFHAISSRKTNWSYVVDEDSPEAIAQGIKHLIENPKLGSELVKNAYIEAEERNSKKYAQVLQKDIDSLD